MSIIPATKPDGSVRICGDFKVTIILVLQIDKHPILKPEVRPVNSSAGGQNIFKVQLIPSISADVVRS